MERSSNPDLLEATSWRHVRPLAGDASQRRYSRLALRHDRTVVLVEYPPSIRFELRRDLEVFGWCRARGIRVPGVEAHDLDRGLALLEDLGDTDAEAAIHDTPPSQRENLLRRMLHPLEILGGIPIDDLPPWNPPLDEARLRWELAGFELWFVRHHRLKPPSEALGRWLDGLAHAVGNHPRRICHRDFHLNNLMVSADGTVGIIDIQDILIGPDTYDAVSLLFERSAERLLTSLEQDELITAWAENTGAPPGWRTRSDAVRLQRGLKVLGTFARFTVSGRSGYSPWMEELCAGLAPQLEAAGAPHAVTSFLLD